jgi:hypothetical protein
MNMSLQSANAAYQMLPSPEKQAKDLKIYANANHPNVLLEQIGIMTRTQVELGAYQAKVLTEIKDLLSNNKPDTFTPNPNATTEASKK